MSMNNNWREDKDGWHKSDTSTTKGAGVFSPLNLARVMWNAGKSLANISRILKLPQADVRKLIDKK